MLKDIKKIEKKTCSGYEEKHVCKTISSDTRVCECFMVLLKPAFTKQIQFSLQLGDTGGAKKFVC